MFDANDPRLTAYVLGELDETERAEVEKALDQSPELRQAVDELQQTAGKLDAALAGENCPALLPEQRESIHAAAEPDSGSQPSVPPGTAPADAAQPGDEPPVQSPAVTVTKDTIGKDTSSSGGRTALLISLTAAAALVLLLLGAGAWVRINQIGAGARDAITATFGNDDDGEEPTLMLDSAEELDSQAAIDPSRQTGSRDQSTPKYEQQGVELTPFAEKSRDRDPRGYAGSERANSGRAPGFDYADGDEDGAAGPGAAGSGGDDGSFDSGPAGRAPSGSPSASQTRPGRSAGPGGPAPPRNSDNYGDLPPREPAAPADPFQREEESKRRAPRGDGRPASRPGGEPPASTPQPRPTDTESGESEGDPRPGKLPAFGGNKNGQVPSGSGDAGDRSDDGKADEGQSGQGREGRRRGEDRDNRKPDEEADPASSDPADVPELVESPDDDAESDEKKGASTKGEGKPSKDGEQDKQTDPKQKPKTNPTWRRDRVVPNASRLMIGDHDELPLKGMQVNVVVDGFRARVLLDCYYLNNKPRQLEGKFKLRLPNEASLYYFAFGETSFEYRPMTDQLASRGFLPAELVRSSGTGPDGIRRARSETWSKVKEARVVPRQKAAHAYSEVVRQRVDPALVEWSGAGVFQAQVFPLMPNKLHRIVIGYDVNLAPENEDLVYKLDLPANLPECQVDLDVAVLPGVSAEVSPNNRPFVSNGRAFYHFPEPPETIKVRIQSPGTVLLNGTDAQAGKFFATRFNLDLPGGEQQASAAQAVFLVDTSLSSNPDKFNVWLRMLENTLNSNRDSMESFAVLFFNIEQSWWKEKFVENTPENVKQLIRHCNTLSLEGATDVHQALREATNPSWAKEVKRAKAPDLFLLSDGAATWGELNPHVLLKTIKAGSGGTLFAYQTGLQGTATEVLRQLARDTGGSVFSVTSEAEVAKAATAHRQRPWRLVQTTVPGGSDLLIAGRPRSIYPGQSLLLVGRGTPEAEATIRVRRGDDARDIRVRFDRQVNSTLAARAYGQVAVGQLENLGDATEKMSIAYARHFRVTGQTCSLLMLDSERDYQRFNIKPEDDLFVVRSSPIDPLVVRKSDELAGTFDDPKTATVHWLKKLENTPGFSFQIPVALQVAIEQMPREAFEVELPRLVCKQRAREDLPKKYFQQLQENELDYVTIGEEAERRRQAYGNADALKVLSNLVERNPGDAVLSQDVAFSAIQWGFGGQAYPLLVRVAKSRPYQPHLYPALAQCAAELGNADLAMIYYEIALNGQWHARYRDVKQIASLQYLHLLRQVVAGEIKTSAPEYAKARLDNLNANSLSKADLVVVMMWNTDRSDVDLHVMEPSGEECYYKNRNTRAGGEITRDVTEGFGPEMYVLRSGDKGRYGVMANYYGTDANRTQMRTKVYITVYHHFGTKQEKVTRHSVLLSDRREKREVASVVLE